MVDSITIVRPDDYHVHLRDGLLLERTVPDTVRRFARAIIMPNLRRPITTVDLALAYRTRILRHVSPEDYFHPLMTLYLTDETTKEEVKAASECDEVVAFKLYPANATSFSAAGVTSIKKIYPILAYLEKFNIPLLIHGEIANPHYDIFDREKLFIDLELAPMIKAFPKLRIVLEHITTAYAVDFIHSARRSVAATITAHHLLLNRNDILAGGIHPHHYCLPIPKRQHDQVGLLAAATSGNPKFFLGTDSAPHTRLQKESSCGCAGIYTSHAALEIYTEIFEAANALELLNDFASTFGARFYGLEPNEQSITLTKQPWQVPDQLEFGEDYLTPFRAGETIQWSITGITDNMG